jgi:L-amino acid N-acyltransferase YncA
MPETRKGQFIFFEDPQLTEAYGFSKELPFLDFSKDKAHGHLILTDSQNKVQARCSLWHKDNYWHEGKKTGFIGHYDSVDEESAVDLLNEAVARLIKYNCQLVVGPIDGNTWRRYRFISQRGDEPAFFLEPNNPDQYPQHFLLAQFQPLASYFSALNKNLTLRDPKANGIENKLKSDGVKLRPFSVENSQADLKAIFLLSLQSFQSNFLYSPIAEEEFMEKYQALLPAIKPNFLLMAEYDGTLVGYVLALPNYNEGNKPETIILKTVARHPGNKYAGLGRYLVDKVQKEALENGYSRVIHALMLDENVSGKISSHYAAPIRKYTLYARQLN